jgi:hypothetical protein
MNTRTMMTEVALNELHQQIETLRREAFAEGYATAMESVRELASRSAPHSVGNTAVTSDTAAGENRAREPEGTKAAMPLRVNTFVRRSRAPRSTSQRTAASPRRSRRRRAERGTNARLIQEVLKKAPRAVRQAEIRNALHRKGVLLSFPSIRHALGQLEARKAAKQVGKSGTWRYGTAA